MAFHTASTMTAPITATRVETMKPCCSYSNPPLTARKMNPPANAPTSPNAILTRQPLPCLPMMRLASQPTMAPNTIQPRMTIPPLRYSRFTYTMVPVAAAMIPVDNQPRPPKNQPARNLPILRRLVATSIKAAIIGTAITPLSTALQYSALMGSMGDQSMPRPSKTAAPITV